MGQPTAKLAALIDEKLALAKLYDMDLKLIIFGGGDLPIKIGGALGADVPGGILMSLMSKWS